MNNGNEEEHSEKGVKCDLLGHIQKLCRRAKLKQTIESNFPYEENDKKKLVYESQKTSSSSCLYFVVVCSFNFLFFQF